MNDEQDYASDTDESDEDFCLENLAGEPAASEDDEVVDSDDNEAGTENAKDSKGRLKKRKKVTTKSNKKKKSKTKDQDDSDDELDNSKEENLQTNRRATRQTEDLNTNNKGKTLEKDELESDDEDKSRTNALWADFLSDVKPEAKAATVKQTTLTTDEKPSSSNFSNGKKQTEMPQANKEDIKAPPNTKTPKEEIKKTIVTEIVDFAGEELRIQREIDVSSIKENKAAATQPRKLQPFGRIMPGAGGLKRLSNSSGAAGSSAGVGSLLNQLGKKKKISVLEKSQMDWNSFKQDEGIDEQLQTHNKGKDGYLERQDFLQRTDVRQFEIEKSLRQTTRRPH